MVASKLVIIAGPTASGKTVAAARLARAFKTAIISADSRQCYRELTIGTAKPSDALLKEIPHYFINSHTLSDTVNASVFEKLALGYAAEIFQKNDLVILCGGTGLYVKAFIEGLDPIPPVPAIIHRQINEAYGNGGLMWLQHEVKSRDPIFYASTDPKNHRRLLRALEVCMATGQTFSSFKSGKSILRSFNTLRIAIFQASETLRSHIGERVDGMVEKGLQQEAEHLWPYRDIPALQTLGYREMFAFMQGEYSLTEAIEKIKLHTWQYATRQMSWLRREGNYLWIESSKGDELLRTVHKFAGN
jgi:tRNA dimethylallyltransferase